MTSKKAELRRYEDDLNICGMGAVIMGVWSIIRICMQFMLNPPDLGISDEDPETAIFVMLFMAIGATVILVMILGIHLYIGINAMKVAQRKKYKKKYFAVTIIALVINAVSMISYKDSLSDLGHIDTTIASMLVDLVTIYILVIIIRSELKVRKLRLEQQQG